MSNVSSISKSSSLISVVPPPTVRAPEIEKGVGCDFDSYLLTPDNLLDDRISVGERPRHYARVALDRMLSLR